MRAYARLARHSAGSVDDGGSNTPIAAEVKEKRRALC
jgi:hypothetical protein